jgi:hypothetical protein
LADEFTQLDLSPDQSLSFLARLGDLYTTKGSAGQLVQRKAVAQQEPSVAYTETTKHDTLDLGHEELQSMVDRDALQTGCATHVVTSVWRGGRIAVTASAFRRTTSSPRPIRR